MNTLEDVRREIAESIAVKSQLDDAVCEKLVELGRCVTGALRAGKKLVLFGNGGSAADAQHLAAELIGRFERERKPYRALALTSNTSTLTALGNDYEYDLAAIPATSCVRSRRRASAALSSLRLRVRVAVAAPSFAMFCSPSRRSARRGSRNVTS
jgi:hypothetical protein